MPKPKTPAPVIPMPPLGFSADRIRELRASLREFNAAIDSVIALLDVMRRPQRTRNLAIVPRRRRRK
jgi:hypothetical protein